MNKILNSLSYVRDHGIQSYLVEFYHRIADRMYERFLNVDTRYIVSEDFELNNIEFAEYSPLQYRHLISELDALSIDKSECTLLDYGCGKGRAVICAASYPFKKVIGIEMSEVIRYAERNIKMMKHKKCRDIELLQCDATSYIVPDDVNVIYFFNPFKGATLESVVDNIENSLRSSPRDIEILYFNEVHFDKLLSKWPWIKRIDRGMYRSKISYGRYLATLS